jgi:hypothetical protein
VLLNGGRFPRLLLTPPRGLRGATGGERFDHFGVLCTDFTGCVSAAIFAPVL